MRKRLAPALVLAAALLITVPLASPAAADPYETTAMY